MAIISHEDEGGVSREIRDHPQPADYLFKVDSFTLLAENFIEKVVSKTFEAGGHQWNIVLYPNGRNGSDRDHLSIYLLMASKDCKAVNAIFRFFLFDQIRDWCLIVEGSSKRFDWVKNEWGYSKFISVEDFKEPTNGYLVDDTCLFGAEVFVSQSSGLRECFSISSINANISNDYTWKITRFSKLAEDSNSDEFVLGGYKWKLWLFPEGDSNNIGCSLSLFLVLQVDNETPSNTNDDKVKAQFTLRLMDQINENHLQKIDTLWFGFGASTYNVWGWGSFIQLKDLKDGSKGFIVDDCCVIEAEVTLLCATHQKSLDS